MGEAEAEVVVKTMGTENLDPQTSIIPVVEAGVVIIINLIKNQGSINPMLNGSDATNLVTIGLNVKQI